MMSQHEVKKRKMKLISIDNTERRQDWWVLTQLSLALILLTHKLSNSCDSSMGC